jgi:GPH family glycoside/pentoside/hexuronide:cation symporter
MEGTLEIPVKLVPIKSRIGISAETRLRGSCRRWLQPAMTYYFTELRGLSLRLTGTVRLLVRPLNAINDPLFGWISDRTRTNLGRRLPYIRYGAPIFVLGFLLFWLDLPGSQGNQTVLFLQMLLALFIFDTLYTAIATSIYIMPYEVAVSNQARSTIYIWKIIFMVFTIVIPLALERTIKPDVGDLAGIALFRLVMVALGVTMGVIIFFSTFFYREKHFAQAEEQFPFFKSLKECFTNRSFVVFETISFTVIFAQTL